LAPLALFIVGLLHFPNCGLALAYACVSLGRVAFDVLPRRKGSEALDAAVSTVLPISSGTGLVTHQRLSDWEFKDLPPAAGNSGGPQTASDILVSDISFPDIVAVEGLVASCMPLSPPCAVVRGTRRGLRLHPKTVSTIRRSGVYSFVKVLRPAQKTLWGLDWHPEFCL
jgi:hypothetical protein